MEEQENLLTRESSREWEVKDILSVTLEDALFEEE
jgi:hypothetical protein